MANTSNKDVMEHVGDAEHGIAIPCCPELVKQPCDEKRVFRYRIPYQARDDDRSSVDLLLVFEFSRCSGGLTQGDIQRTITLLPQEFVRLSTVDKSSRWSYDKESSLSYRHERTTAESHFSFGFAKSVSDLNVSEDISSDSSYDESWAEGGGGASVNLGFISIGGGGGGGSYSADSSYDFARDLSQHAESSASYMAASVAASHAVTVGEVETREHAEGESEQHYESSARRIQNNNRCHAVNYFIWQLMKIQKVSWSLKAVEIRVREDAAPTLVRARPRFDNKLSVTPQSVLATDIAFQKVAIQPSAITATHQPLYARFNSAQFNVKPLDVALRQSAKDKARAELVKKGILDEKGQVSKKLIAELSWEKEVLIPTDGLVIKGCLDSCSVCEPAQEKAIALELRNKELANHLLEKQIELLDKHQDYRCCPVGCEEEEV